MTAPPSTTRSRWLAAVIGAGLAFFALSFVNAWIVHERELTGEGYRSVSYGLSAWRGLGIPVLTVAALGALGVAGWAGLHLRRPATPAWPILTGAAAVAGLIVAASVPLEHRGQASYVMLGPGVMLPVGAALAALLVVAGAAVVRPSPRRVAALAVMGVAVAAAGVGGRWIGLDAAQGDNRFWEAGSYVLPADGVRPGTTLVLEEGAYRIGEAYAGTLEWSGWTVILDRDPACPGSRGAYHVHGEDDGAIRFVKVVDTCRDGERAAILESAIWQRAP